MNWKRRQLAARFNIASSTLLTKVVWPGRATGAGPGTCCPPPPNARQRPPKYPQRGWLAKFRSRSRRLKSGNTSASLSAPENPSVISARFLMPTDPTTPPICQRRNVILNHKDAIEFLMGSAGEIGFNRHTILNLHALLANNLLADTQATGRLLRIAVGIEKSAFYPLEVPQRIEECFDQILATAEAI